MLPAFSPDGRSIAYLGRRSKNEFGRNVRVFTVATDGGTPRCLTLGLDRSCAPLGARPIWSPDGRSITFAAEDQGALGVYRVGAVDGAPPVRLIDGERVVTGFSLSADGGRIAFAATDPVTPAEVFVASGDGGAASARSPT